MISALEFHFFSCEGFFSRKWVIALLLFWGHMIVTWFFNQSTRCIIHEMSSLEVKDTQILTKLMFVASDSFHLQCICLLFYTIIFDVFLYDKFSIPVAVLSLFSLYAVLATLTNWIVILSESFSILIPNQDVIIDFCNEVHNFLCHLMLEPTI